MQAMQENPSMLKAAANMMSSMSPEQLEAVMGRMPGGLKMTPEMAKMAAEQVGGDIRLLPGGIESAWLLAGCWLGCRPG
jgi:hypothetical protein